MKKYFFDNYYGSVCLLLYPAPKCNQDELFILRMISNNINIPQENKKG